MPDWRSGRGPRAPLPPAVREHLEAISGRFGILQHAIGRTGDPQHGHCSDDVARALELDLMQARQLGWSAVADRARSNLRFLRDSYVPAERWFRNFRDIDGEWLEGSGSEDCQGRAALALGAVVATVPDPTMVATARSVLLEIAAGMDRLQALRPIASSVLGLGSALDGGLNEVREAHRRLAHRLHAAFARAEPDWYWPESIVTYENALLSRALIDAGSRLNEPAMTGAGIGSLDWLIRNQTAPAGHLSPVGNGWWPRGGSRSQFDQQPIEATALLRACRTALAATGQRRYAVAMEQAYGWFLGANDLGIPLVDAGRGAGRDGLGAHGVNRNAGAESTLMWLIAIEQMRSVRKPTTDRSGIVEAPTAFLA